MKHGTETIKAFLETLTGLVVDYMNKPFVSLNIHISEGNKKIGKVYNWSMAPIVTCGNCSCCSRYCYDIKACLQYPNVRTARAENTAMMKMDREKTFSMIDEFISKKKVHKAFRWHVSGEILDVDYFDRMIKIARRYPDWIFWTYTKMYFVVNEWIRKNGKDALPSNLSVMFSVWNGLPCPNPYNMPTFTCIQESMTPDPREWRCPGNCDICLKSGHGCPHGESSNVDEH